MRAEERALAQLSAWSPTFPDALRAFIDRRDALHSPAVAGATTDPAVRPWMAHEAEKTLGFALRTRVASRQLVLGDVVDVLHWHLLRAREGTLRPTVTGAWRRPLRVLLPLRHRCPVLTELAALLFLSGAGFLAPFSGPQLDALAYLFLELHGKGIEVVSIFWGLWLFPFGVLVMRSGFIPRWLGVLLLVAGVGYVVAASTAILLPEYLSLVSRVTTPFQFAEIPIVFWLAIWGAREQAVPASAAA